LILADWIRLVISAARLPAARVPANSQFLRPVAQGRICYSSWLLSVGRRGSSRKNVSTIHRFRL